MSQVPHYVERPGGSETGAAQEATPKNWVEGTMSECTRILGKQDIVMV